MDAGLSAGDLITHVNGTSVQGLLHIELVRLILTGGASVALRTVPLASTSIRIGARKVPSVAGGIGMVCGPEMGGPEQMPYTPLSRHRRRPKYDRHRASLFRQLSNRKAAEQQLTATSSPLSPHQRSLSSSDSVPGSPTTVVPRLQSTSGIEQWTSDSAHSSSQSSSPGSSAPGSPAVAGTSPVPITVGGRPSSLHGLKHHKLSVSRPAAGSRRKSWHNNPLSPLVRTPSPSPGAATSPSRSPSPLTTASGIHHRHITGGAPLVAAHVPGISNMAQLYNPAQPHTGIGLTAAAASNQSHKPAVLAATDAGLLRRTLSPERRLSGQHQSHRHSHGEMHRRSMTGQLERGIGLLGVEPIMPQPDTSLRPGIRHHHSMRATQSSGGTVTSSLTFFDNMAAGAAAVGQGDVGSFGDRRRDSRFYGRGVPPEPLRVDIDPPSQPVSFTSGACPSQLRTCESSQLKPVPVDFRTSSAQDVTLSSESCAFKAAEHSLGGGDCVRPLSELSEDASKAFVVGVKSSVHKGGPRPPVIPSIPIAIRTGTKEGKDAKDSKRAGSNK